MHRPVALPKQDNSQNIVSRAFKALAIAALAVNFLVGIGLFATGCEFQTTGIPDPHCDDSDAAGGGGSSSGQHCWAVSQSLSSASTREPRPLRDFAPIGIGLGIALALYVVSLIARRLGRHYYTVSRSEAKNFWLLTNEGLVSATPGRYWFRSRDRLFYIPFYMESVTTSTCVYDGKTVTTVMHEVRFKSETVSVSAANAFYAWWLSLYTGQNLELAAVYRLGPHESLPFTISEPWAVTSKLQTS
jgi:hypothetical protein